MPDRSRRDTRPVPVAVLKRRGELPRQVPAMTASNARSGRRRIFESVAYVAAFIGLQAPWGHTTIEWMGKTNTESVSLGMVASRWDARLVALAIATALVLQFIPRAARFRGIATVIALAVVVYYAFSFFAGSEKWVDMGGSFVPGVGMVLTLGGLVAACVLWGRGLRRGFGAAPGAAPELTSSQQRQEPMALTPSAPAGAPLGAESTEAKLLKLKSLLDKGLITPDQFEAKRGELLAELF